MSRAVRNSCEDWYQDTCFLKFRTKGRPGQAIPGVPIGFKWQTRGGGAAESPEGANRRKFWNFLAQNWDTRQGAGGGAAAACS